VVLHEVISEAETPAGRRFDVLLILAILVSVTVVMLESIPAVNAVHGPLLRQAEWGFTLLFTVEYILRLVTVDRPGRYARSFFGIVDLLAVVPTWISLILPGAQALLVIRVLRVLRVFRILKLGAYVGEAGLLVTALKASRRKITVFMISVLTIVSIVGALMYVLEGPASGFTSIPISVYWAVVTLTTVGYGDLIPLTPPGKLLAVGIMVLGYAIIAVPTGIMTMEITNAARAGARATTEVCQACGREGHDTDARHCKWCGENLGRTAAGGDGRPGVPQGEGARSGGVPGDRG
jgi:voltage-gated potassium channel